VEARTDSARSTDIRRVVAASFMGTAMETYDLYLYGTASALIFSKLYFSQDDPAVALVLSLSTFGVSFLARPLGAIVFGHFGDRLGRKNTLYATLLLMGLSTAMIGFLPTYASIGIAAPIILVVLRFLQGIGFGGEYSGAILMITEHAPQNKRGFYAGLNNVGPAFGFIASSGLVLILSLTMSETTFLGWGWRIPFLVSFVLVAIGLYLRHSIAESPVFEATAARDAASPIPLAIVVRHYRRELLLGSGAITIVFALFYMVSVHTLSFAVSAGMDRNTVLIVLICAVAVYGAVLPVFSKLSDSYGRKRLCLIGAGLAAAWQFPFYLLLDTGDVGALFVATAVELVIYAVIYGPSASYVGELFGARGRYTGSALAFNSAGILGAAPAPIVATLLVERSGATWPIALFMIGIATLSFVCLLALPETRDNDLLADRSDPATAEPVGVRDAAT
jgi:MFS family permease